MKSFDIKDWQKKYLSESVEDSNTLNESLDFNTVGGIIEYLKKFDPNTPIAWSADIESGRGVITCDGEECGATPNYVGGKVLINVGGEETDYQ